ncbi:hypothetical protein N566_12905 [Streptomycetaceae bacterium MP113-05]|nr:hypothetical protein N566_12905 [Streptomycetaceae bacterium MP113-05]
MTSDEMPHGSEEHPEVAELSDLAEGLLPVSRSREVRAHLEHCDLCADVRASLDEIRHALGSLPGPPRMPDDVAGRIDAALAAEALLDSEHRDGVPTPVSRGTAPDDPVAVSRETSRSSPATDSRPTPRGPRSAGPGRGNRRSFARHRRALLTTAGAVGALLLGGAVLQGVTGGSTTGGDAGGAAEDRSVRSGGDDSAFAADGLDQRVQDLLSRSASGAEGGPELTSETEKPSSAPLAGGASVLPSCVRAGIDRPEQPLAAAPGRADAGGPSYLVVLPHPGDPQRVDAYVVDSSCATESGGEPAEILVEQTFSRD